MVSVLASIVVDRGCEHRSGQTKDYNIGICCFSDKHEIRIISNQEKDQTVWLGIRIMCGAAYLSADYCVSKLPL
jgi:hypothetical protein